MNGAGCLPFIVFVALMSLGAGPASSEPATGSTIGPVIQMIFWEKQSWETGGSSARLTLWADGRSQITVREFGKPAKTKPGWTAKEDKSWMIYTKESPYSVQDARTKFDAAIAAEIDQLRTFPPGYADGSGTVSGVSVDGTVTQTLIPMFLHEGEKDNKGSENHRRFLAVDAILGTFDTEPTGR